MDMPAGVRNALGKRDGRPDRIFQACGSRSSPPNNQNCRNNTMPGRRSFKTDERFLEKLAIGAIGARAVFKDLQRQGHKPVELERGSMDYRDGRNTDMPAALPNALEHVVTTSPPTGMPLQATGQSEKLILRPPWRGVLAQKPLMPLAVSSSRSAILTHRFCHTAERGHWCQRSPP